MSSLAHADKKAFASIGQGGTIDLNKSIGLHSESHQRRQSRGGFSYWNLHIFRAERPIFQATQDILRNYFGRRTCDSAASAYIINMLLHKVRHDNFQTH
ncbi:hypothetical protein [Massilia sp. YIM B04103]|uniref:hypothetical protein n=1 Tax=Massilia sp. YIM B04103 TaxID=2963106 RepID=UPI0021097385|nr:hypothetical protein [Massilia sp. YIM B04103]